MGKARGELNRAMICNVSHEHIVNNVIGQFLQEILYGPQNLGKSKSKGKNNGGADWTSSRDDSWTSKNGSPNWTSDAAPKVLATPTPQNQVTGGGGKAKGASSSTTSAGTQSSGTNSKGKKAGESETSTGVKSQESSDDSGWHNWGSW